MELDMRRTFACFGFLFVVLTAPGGAQQGQPAGHALLMDTDLKWGEPPPALPKGATVAVLSGDPGQPGPFTVRVKFPAGYKIAPHWHPTDEHVTVLSGTLAFGMGEKVDPASMKKLSAGGYARMPAEMRHYVEATAATMIQIHGVGPFTLNYVNPADDPRKTGPTKD
jgi:quercetin dioxygenase-like cupin family protein